MVHFFPACIVCIDVGIKVGNKLSFKKYYIEKHYFVRILFFKSHFTLYINREVFYLIINQYNFLIM